MSDKLIPNPDLKLSILFEDESFLVIDKSPLLPCYPLRASETETCANALVAHAPLLAFVGSALEAGIVHRLDNTTSGILIAAKNPQAYDYCRSIWNSEKVNKTYLAVAHGIIPQKLEIGYPIAHHPDDAKRMIVCSNQKQAAQSKAREAHSLIERVEMYPWLNSLMLSLARVVITTGVRHQIRVHLAYAGFPLVGDKLYNKNSRSQLTLWPRELNTIQRPLLHLQQVNLPHPVTGKILVLKSRGDADFEKLRSFCRKIS